MLLLKTTIFHSPFPSEVVEKIFGKQDSELLVTLYNKSLLSRMEEDECGSFNDKFWLYSIHLALRNYLENKYKDLILNLETESIVSFCNCYYNLVKNTYKALGKDDHTDLIRQFVRMTRSENNDYDRAIEFAINIKEKQEKLRKQISAKIAVYLGLIYRELGYYDKSLIYHKKALNIHLELGDMSTIAKDYAYIGVIYCNKNQFDYALEYEKKALKIHFELGDRDSVSKEYGDIGLVYCNKGEFDNALEYHKKALKIHLELTDRVNLILYYYNISLAYLAKNDKSEAITAANNTLKIVEEFEQETQTKHPFRDKVNELLSLL